jgi:hypothetical protein
MSLEKNGQAMREEEEEEEERKREEGRGRKSRAGKKGFLQLSELFTHTRS